MKAKYFTILSIVLVIVSLLSCKAQNVQLEDEPRYTAEEWEKIQENEEYLSIKDEIIEFDKTYGKISDQYSNDIIDLSEEFKYYAQKNNKNKLISILEEREEVVSNFKEEFQKLYIPEPLDGFYYLKLEEVNYDYKLVSMGLSYYKTGTGDLERVKEYSDKSDKLNLEADKEKRRVYREYDLDDLLGSN